MICGPDVMVAGDGPAGAGVSLRLASRGLSVWLVSRRRRAPAPPGETLPPQIRNVLAKLGASSTKIAEGALESYGIQARWGGNEHFHSHLFDAHGNGWHVNHDVLSSDVLDQARRAGVRVLRSTTIMQAARQSGLWRVVLSRSHSESQLSCRFIVDATGRTAAFSRFTGVHRRRLDNLCGVAGVFPRSTVRGTLSVASVPYGWWYASPLPNDRILACLMSDIDVIRRLDAHTPKVWTALLKQSGLTGTEDVQPLDGLRLAVLPCETSILQHVHGDGWVAVGDAACVFDPLASAGVIKAFHTARVAADEIVEYLAKGSDAGLERYSHQVSSDFDRYMAGRHAQYRLERQWADQPFWLRRSA